MDYLAQPLEKFLKFNLFNLRLKCPNCSSCQYRQSPYDISVINPYGAKCIFCKTVMMKKIAF